MNFNLLFKTQSKFVNLIKNTINKNRLSQVYLLSGDKGTLKKEGALYLASLILCDKKEACGECKSCLEIENNTNHNLFIIDGSDINTNTIKKEQIEDLMHEFSLASDEVRVFIIYNIEKATTASSNTLLKFLEEMKDNTYGILTTDNLDGVLQTIRSRAQIISFEKISKDDLIKFYESKSIDEEMARILCSLTNDVNEGLKLNSDEVFLDILKLVKSINKAIITGDDPILVMNEEGRNLLSVTDKYYHQIFINLLILITNDRLFYILGMRDEMVFLNTFESLDNDGVDCRSIGYKDTLKQLDVMLEYKEKINYNLNLELMYMDLFIKCEV